MAGPERKSRIPRDREPLGDQPSPFEHIAAGEPHDRQCVEWCPICRTADVFRATAPPEVREQWQAVQREALLTARALIDTYLDRIDGEEPAGEARVVDIPIE